MHGVVCGWKLSAGGSGQLQDGPARLCLIRQGMGRSRFEEEDFWRNVEGRAEPRDEGIGLGCVVRFAKPEVSNLADWAHHAIGVWLESYNQDILWFHVPIADAKRMAVQVV